MRSARGPETSPGPGRYASGTPEDTHSCIWLEARQTACMANWHTLGVAEWIPPFIAMQSHPASSSYGHQLASAYIWLHFKYTSNSWGQQNGALVEKLCLGVNILKIKTQELWSLSSQLTAALPLNLWNRHLRVQPYKPKFSCRIWLSAEGANQ